MRALLLSASLSLASACGNPTSASSDAGVLDGAAGSSCDTANPKSCSSGLVCCAPCRGIPYPPDFGPILGNCTSNCQPQICP